MTNLFLKIELAKYDDEPGTFLIVTGNKIVASGPVQPNPTWTPEPKSYINGYYKATDSKIDGAVDGDSFTTWPKIGYHMLRVVNNQIFYDRRAIVSIEPTDDQFDPTKLKLDI